MKRCLFLLLAATSLYATSVGPIDTITFTINLSHSKNFNAISDVVIFGTDGVQTSAVFTGPIAATGQTTLRAGFNFTPTRLLLMGMEGPALNPTCFGDGTVCNGNDTGDHALFLVNNYFAGAFGGQHFSVAFGQNGYHETVFLQNLVAASTSSASLDFLRTFFLSSDGVAASFVPGESTTALEFFIGTPVGTGTSTGGPEPATALTLLSGLGAAYWLRRRR